MREPSCADAGCLASARVNPYNDPAVARTITYKGHQIRALAVPIGESVVEALLRIMRPDLLEQYRQEKERHREELRAIEQALERAQQMIRRLFGGLRERKEAELKQEHTERVQGEADRHAKWMAELREAIRDHLSTDGG